jgi:Fe-S oxidoreductase
MRITKHESERVEIDKLGANVELSTEPSETRTVEKFRDFLVNQMTVEQQLALDACLHCGSCGEACSWYQATGDEARHPLYRKEFIRRVSWQTGTWGGKVCERLGIVKAIDARELEAPMESFWKCTGCGRCTLACPLSLSNRSVFRLARSAYSACKMSEKNPTRRSIIENTRQHDNSFGLTKERTLLRLAFHLAMERTDVPLDRRGADYLLAVPTVDVVRFPEQLYRLFQV